MSENRRPDIPQWLADPVQRDHFLERIDTAARAGRMSRRQFLSVLGLGGAAAWIGSLPGNRLT
ncbi:MAG: twin-arginine translocation signal domain-containing protein [Oscillochloris sp.]|nr:twin-arginine translocation signal domain-containing protein [Oscillochloris sp.]